MANPTTNYGFVLPTSTDLVTDLPADFDVALQGVDTRLKALQPGTTLGDLAYSSATANTNTRLGVGTNGQVLAVSGGVPAWTTTSDVTPLTTKGDLFTFTTVDARLGIGANNTVLTADSAEATGMKWAAVASSGKSYSLLNAGGTALTGAATITISGISGIDDLMILINDGSSANGSSDIFIRFNSDSGSNYAVFGQFGTAIGNRFSNFSTTGAYLTTMGALASSEMAGFMRVSGCNTSGSKIYNMGATADNGALGVMGGVWKNSATVSSVSIISSSGNFDKGTIYIYGAA